MKRGALLFFFMVVLSLVLVSAKSLPIIPLPVKQSINRGTFAISERVKIYYQASFKKEAYLLASRLEEFMGKRLGTFELTQKRGRGIYLTLVDKKEGNSSESYRLKVTSKQIEIQASDAAGIYYGTQSLLQLVGAKGVKIPNCEVIDSPRFKWRGMMVDVGRHFFAVEDLKKFINWMSLHKLNRFHWHLTEDQGWRIEIKKYPKLTSIGAWRTSTPPYGDRYGFDHKRYGGFYTQEQIKDLVAYAKERHVTIMPEIDLPGHMSAALAAYPEFGNNDVEGYQPKVQTRWGIFPYVLAPTEKTFKFLEDLFDEICDLFPSEYIHIGGDEAKKGEPKWEQSKVTQEIMRKEGLEGGSAVQSYIIKRVEKILQDRGRKLVGWDEIREGGLAKSATVMSWRGMKGGTLSAKEGHDVVMAPSGATYFDHYQAPKELELAKGSEYEAIRGFTPISKVYHWDPVPKRLKLAESKHILGCQGQLWTEYMKTWDKLEYMAFPRIAALAEVAWSHDKKNYEDFKDRLKPLMALYKKAGINTAEVYEKDKK